MSCLPYDSSCDSTLYILLAIGIVSSCIVWFNFTRLIHSERLIIKHEKIQILSLRVALVLAYFPLSYVLKYVFPIAVTVLTAVESFIEGYCIVCYFKMMIEVVRCSSPEGARAIEDSKNPDAPYDRSYYYYYNRIFRCLFVLRPIFDLIAGLGELEMNLNPNRKIETMYVVFTGFQMTALTVGMIALIRSYHYFAAYASHGQQEWNLLWKILFMKGSILVFTVQGFVIILYSRYGKIDMDTKLLAYRYYSFVCLCEICMASFGLSRVFSSSRPLKNNNNPSTNNEGESSNSSNNNVNEFNTTPPMATPEPGQVEHDKEALVVTHNKHSLVSFYVLLFSWKKYVFDD